MSSSTAGNPLMRTLGTSSPVSTGSPRERTREMAVTAVPPSAPRSPVAEQARVTTPQSSASAIPSPSPVKPRASVDGSSGSRTPLVGIASGVATNSPTTTEGTPAESTPTRTRSGSHTHAGGILPPASFFRPSRPNSSRPPSAAFLASSPIRTSGIGGVGIGLPFKANSSSGSSAGSPAQQAARTSGGLPSAFKPPSLALGPAGGRVGKTSTEPLLPVGEQKSRIPTAAEGPSGTGAGVKSSFERIWRKGMSVRTSAIASSSASSAVVTPPRKSADRKGSASDDGGEDVVEEEGYDLEAARTDGEDVLPVEEEGETRNHYAQEDSAEMEEPLRLTVDDIGDGAAGGGVVMEMGRLSMAADSIRSRGSALSVRLGKRTNDIESGVDESSRGGSRIQSLDSPVRTPGGGVGVSFSFESQQHQRPSPLPHSPLSLPPTPGQQSRHAHFAPSPTKSAKANLSSAGGQAQQDRALPQTNSSNANKHLRSLPPLQPSSEHPGYMVPVLSPRNSEPMRNYESYPSQNKFFLKGHLITGGDSPWAFVGALLLALGIAGTWFGTTCVFWWHRGAGGQAVAIVGAYLTLLTISSMLMTAFRDPGILPRDLDPEPPYPPISSMTTESTPVPLPRDLRVRGGPVRVKYCVTCKTYRPPRSSHCKICDNCVDGCDHHCQWVNNCVGRRNYIHFITFVITASITALGILATAIIHIYLLTHDRGYSVRQALKHAIGSAVAIAMCVVVIWPLLALTLYHVRLLLLNITTIEQVRNQAHRKLTNAPTPTNPFTIGRWYHNVAYLVCRPPGYSWIDLSGYAMHDTRKVNPGFIVRPASASDVDGGARDSREADSWR